MTKEKLNELLGDYSKVIHEHIKDRVLAKFDGDAAKASEMVLKAQSPAINIPAALEAGLILQPPGDASAYPVVPGAPADGPHNGKLVADGGALDDSNAEAYGKIVELAGGVDKAVLGVVFLATCSLKKEMAKEFSVHQSWYNKWEKTLESFNAVGLKTERILLIPFCIDNTDEQDSQEYADMLRKCTGIWMPGGEHYRMMINCFRGNTAEARGPACKFQEALLEKYRAGTVIAGTSSGAFVICSGPLVTGGQVYKSLTGGASVNTRGLVPELTYDPHGGYGFISGAMYADALVDAHCPEKGRTTRLVRLLSDVGKPYGIGIGENTQLVYDCATGIAEVLGSSAIHFLDLTSAVKGSGPHFSISGVKFTSLSRNDKINLFTGEITWAPWKKPVVTTSDAPYVSSDVCQSIAGAETRQLSKAAAALCKSTATESTSVTSETDPVQFKIVLKKGPGFSAIEGDCPAGSFFSGSFASFSGMLFEIQS